MFPIRGKAGRPNPRSGVSCAVQAPSSGPAARYVTLSGCLSWRFLAPLYRATLAVPNRAVDVYAATVGCVYVCLRARARARAELVEAKNQLEATVTALAMTKSQLNEKSTLLQEVLQARVRAGLLRGLCGHLSE